MAVSMRSFVVKIGVGLLALALLLTGCVGEWTPEESAARTATVSAYMVPTKTPSPEVTVPPTPEPSATNPPANTPTPVSATSPEPLDVNLPVGTQAGQLSPDFRLNDASGQPVILSDLRGQPVVVIFWASWCAHCQKEMPLVQSLYEKYGDQGLSVIGVNVPGLGGDTVENALAFVADKCISFPVVFDEGARVYQEYKVNGVPNLFFIDRDGVVVTAYPGAMDAERLENQIKGLLEVG
jgi:cytochrome c biogenesis protein CcmG/thiol:disulfide interchange protein DsbE